MWIQRLDAKLYSRFPADEIFVLDFDDPSIGSVCFAIAYDGDKPVG
jgi:putative acetyltransferase